MEDRTNEGMERDVLFIHLVTMFHVAAMQQLGKVMNPVTQKIERDLDQAKFAIDTLDMVKEKTKGNLSKEEEDFLNKTLFELHMNYLDEISRAEKGEKEAEKEEEASQPGGEGEAGMEARREPSPEEKGKGKGKAARSRAKGKKRAAKKKEAGPDKPS
ncbi:MAG: DUF1844 domain-containing protein [Candidatus Latescibacteria bacterium]|nr:DUF1844 domain-containing protein [Candidatus Latescibacterota bacterium]NIM21653.1 DUF1844 domain-containing protein [Candidatus Latescibacterota bacterium]NIM64632.1 DUF1844 domain-containing protein [Candidatus Latescibacterota bacterium]NIO01147.1 DUF1844 domain-containing protein [Candidatus Latescibacterota bacterium]NIO27540.1 DUF1844 domain-containing protein [Candidatus Latescibacterota bacterium]